MGQPLAVARPGGRSDIATSLGCIGKIEARIPDAGALSLVSRKVSTVLHLPAEAGRSGKRAIGAAQAARPNLIPMGVIQVGQQ